MMFRIGALALLAGVANAAIEGAKYDYDHVDNWNSDFLTGTFGGIGCNGSKQSPIALNSMDCTMYANYELNQGDCSMDDFDFVINNNGVQMNLKAGATCTKPHFVIPYEHIYADEMKKDTDFSFYGGAKYNHAQTHIHLSSEHTIDGKYFAAELHMVHLNDDFTSGGSQPRASVLGTMIHPTLPYDNPTFEHWLQRWVEVQKENGCDECTEHYTFAPEADYKLDVYENMEGKDFYHYDGGLTTPGCDEVVWWNFNTEPWLISVRQFNIMANVILKFKKPTAGVEGAPECAADEKPFTIASKGASTSRPPQPLNGRVVKKVCNFA